MFFTNLFLNIRLWFHIKIFKSVFLKNNRKERKIGWSLTFKDYFRTLNRSIWRTDTYYGSRYHPGSIENKGEAPKVYYDDDSFKMYNSKLALLCERKSTIVHHKNYGKYSIPYKVGQLDSSNYFKQKYGYFELRCKMPNAPAHWPAFWLASIYDWPPEIDIFESYTTKNGFNSISTNVHWSDFFDDRKMKPKKHTVLPINKGFHLYACEWNKNYIKFYYDNLLIRKEKTPENYYWPMHIIINQSVENKYVDLLLNESFPTEFILDYVRAYKKN